MPEAILLQKGDEFHDIVNDASERELFHESLSFAALGPSGVLRLELCGDIRNGTPVAQSGTIRIYIGSSKVFDDSIGIFPNGGRRPWLLTLSLVAVGTAGRAILTGSFVLSSAGGAFLGTGDLSNNHLRDARFASNGVVLLDQVAPQALRVTWQHSERNPSLSLRRYHSSLWMPGHNATSLRGKGMTVTTEAGGIVTLDATNIPVVTVGTGGDLTFPLTLTKANGQGKRLFCTKAGTITVNASTNFDDYQCCMIEADGGDVTIAASGATVNTANGQGLVILQHSTAILIKRAADDRYRLEGAMG